MVASFLLMAVTGATAKPCLTKEEARKQWPNERLYWHTERHCWDQIKGTSGTYEERQPEPTQEAANISSGFAAKAGDDNDRKDVTRARYFLSNDGFQ